MSRYWDWLIIGGGAPALVCAFYLQARGARTLVADNNNPSASRAGAGILSPLPPWQYPPPLRRLAEEGAAAYPALLAALGDDCGYRRCGMLVLPPFDEPAARAWRQAGGAAESIGARQLHAALPPLESLLLPQVAALQPRRLLKALRRRLTRRAATVKQCVVQKNKVTHVQLADGERLTADNVLLAAGAWSGGLCPPPAPAIRPVRGQMLLYDDPGFRLPAALLQAARGFYVLQREDGRLLAGSTSEEAGYDSRPTAAGIALLRSRAAALLPALAGASPRAAWAGLRPAADAPIICRHPALDNLYLNCGHFRYGVTMAPAAAAHVLKIAAGELAPQENIYGY